MLHKHTSDDDLFSIYNVFSSYKGVKHPQANKTPNTNKYSVVAESIILNVGFTAITESLLPKADVTAFNAVTSAFGVKLFKIACTYRFTHTCHNVSWIFIFNLKIFHIKR